MKFATHQYVSEHPSRKEVYESLVPPVRRWVEENMASLNELQLMTIPLISSSKSTLILAPTGSGKTLAAFLGIINHLYSLAINGDLEERIYAVYVSPLRALNNDIHKNLQLPLQGISKFLPEGVSSVRSLVRTGDTSSYEKSKMLKKPPHILITTPESLGIALASKKFSTLLRRTDWFLIDEIHALAEDKRGVFLSLVVEWLEYVCEKPPVRIGLSATISPVPVIANYLMGLHEDARTVYIVDYGTVKELELEVMVPDSELRPVFQSHIIEEHVKQILHLLQEYQTSIIFANTRHWSERVAKDLIALAPEELKDKISVHHSSLDREVRFETENRMKQGVLKAIVTSASLELGIDVGSIDLAVQLNSPKTVNRALQRVGRAGHFFLSVSTGKFLVGSLDDLLEITALTKLCLEGILDEVHLPMKPFDVLAQIIVGLTIDQNWEFPQLYNLICRSFNYHTMTEEELLSVIESMSSPLSSEENWKYGRIWFDKEHGIIGRKGYQRQNFMMNIGTIPDTTSIEVVLEGSRNTIGTLSERFAELLTGDSIFMLGGRTYLFLRTVGSKIIVREVFNVVPTIPSWRGEAMSRSLNVSYEVGRILRKFDQELSSHRSNPDEKREYLIHWLGNEYGLGERESHVLFSYLHKQYSLNGLPSEQKLMVEKYIDVTGRCIVIVLSIFGLAVNLPLAYAYSKALSDLLGCHIGVTANDNGFSLILPPGVNFDKQLLFSLIQGEEEFMNFLNRALEETELFKTRFRHIAVRGLMVLKRSPRRKLSMDMIQRSAQKLIRELPREFPLLNETRREIFYDVYHTETAREVILAINSGNMEITNIPDDNPVSPLAHSIILSAVSDVVLSDDRNSLLLDLHRQMLGKLREREEDTVLFDPDEIARYYETKYSNKERYSDQERLQAFIASYRGPLPEFMTLCKKRTGLSEETIMSILSNTEELFILQDRYWTLDLILPELLFNTAPEQLTLYASGTPVRQSTRQFISDLLKEVPPLTIVEKGISTYLKYLGPLTVSELVEFMNIKQEIIEEGVFSMQRRGDILAGEFTKTTRQYMLTEDRSTLASFHLSYQGLTLNQLNFIRFKRHHLLQDSPDGEVSVEDMLERHGPVRHVSELWARYSCFSWSDLRLSLDHFDVFYGRFFAGKLCFVNRSLLSLLTSVYRTGIEIDDNAKMIFNFIKHNVVASYSQLSNHLPISQSELKDGLRVLENELYIGRLGWSLSLSSSSKNVLYHVLPPSTSQELGKAAADLILRVITWYGPLMIPDIIRITKFEYALVESSIQYLEREGRLTHFSVMAPEFLYYGLPSDLQEMHQLPRNIQINKELTLLPMYDPLLYSSIGTVFHVGLQSGEVYHVLHNGTTVGEIELIDAGDYIQVNNILVKREVLDDYHFLELLASTLFSLAQKVYLTRNVVIEEIRSKPPNFTENSLFTLVMCNNGFFLDVDHLVGGLTHPSSLKLDEVMQVKLRNLMERKKVEKDISKVVHDLGKFSLAHLQSIVDLPLQEILMFLSSEIRSGNLHYRGKYMYTKVFWNQLKADEEGLTPLEHTLLDLIPQEGISIHSLSKKVRQTDVAIRDALNELERRNLIDKVNPFDSTTVWRRSWRPNTRSKINLDETILSLVRLYGPISFEELLRHHEDLMSYSKGMLLLHISQLIQDNSISTVWLGEHHKKVFYFVPEMKDFILDPGRSSRLPEWMMVDSSEFPLKELLGISGLYFYGITHAVFHRGRVVATLKITTSQDTLCVEHLRLSLSLSDQEILEVIREIEDLTQQLSVKKIVIRSLFGHTPIYWRD